MSRSPSPSQTTNSQTPTINEELEATLLPQTSDARESFVLQNCLPKDEKSEDRNDSNVIPQAALRPFSQRPLARALRDIAFAIFPLYFLVFAILTYRQDGKPSNDTTSVNLLAVAKYGPTAFGIMFAAIVGRSLTCAAAAMLERGASVGAIESFLGARTVFGAATLPLRFRFLHPVMLLLALLWVVSPLGGQAALRAIGTESHQTTRNSTFSYLDTFNSTPYSFAGQNAWRSAVLTSFNAALGSPVASKKAGQDIYGNLKIPMIEPLTSESPRDGGWYDTATDSDIWYSSLTGLPVPDSLPDEGVSEFNVESWYAYVNCTLEKQTDWAPYNMRNAIPGYDVLYNDLTLTFRLKNDTFKTGAGQPITFSMHSRDTNATCTVAQTRVETHFACTGKICESVSIRTVDTVTPVPQETQTLGNHFSMILKLISMASNVGYQANDELTTSPVEEFFINPDYPFTGEGQGGLPDFLSLGNDIFSLRLTQLFNTCWLASVAASLVLGRPIEDADRLRGGALTQMALSHGTITDEHKVIVCHKAWFWILCFSSIIMLSAGFSSVVIDFIRRGPDVLDGLSLALRDNAFVRFPTGSSMDDGDDLARRFKKVKVRLGDVHSQKDIGHVAVGTPVPDQPVGRLVEGRSYV